MNSFFLLYYLTTYTTINYLKNFKLATSPAIDKNIFIKFLITVCCFILYIYVHYSETIHHFDVKYIISYMKKRLH